MTSNKPDKQQKRHYGREMGLLLVTVTVAIELFTRHSAHASQFTLWIGLIAGIVTLLAPAVLYPLYQGWMKLALILAMVINPLVLGLIYFLVFTPVGITMRLFKIDLLQTGTPDENTTSMWRKRGTDLTLNMKKQF